MVALNSARKDSKCATKRMQKEWWDACLEKIEDASRCRDSRRLFSDVRQMGKFLHAKGITKAPLVANQSDHLKKLGKHFEKVLNIDTHLF